MRAKILFTILAVSMWLLPVSQLACQTGYDPIIRNGLVNGQIGVDKRQRTAALAGLVLRGPGYRRSAMTNEKWK